MLSTVAVANTGNVLIDALVWGQKWTSTAATLTIKVGIMPTVGMTPTTAETNAILSVLAEFERVLNVDFVFVGVDTAGAADLTFKFYNDASEGRYGWSIPAGEARVSGFADVNILRNNYADPALAFAVGSSDYITLVHEFAHALGLAHPHDRGGGSGVFPGVTSPTTPGYFGLNQGVYTTMSYLDGNQSAEAWGWGISYWSENAVTGEVSSGRFEYSSSDNATEYGLQSGLMALDIAALQLLYGANTQFAAGDNVYALPTANAVGTAYTSIWDTAGTDTIMMPGLANCTIDLRAATLQVAEGGGGFVSSAVGVEGGFTIAANVGIENAIGNAGNDVLIGNGLANRLEGGAGNDTLTGGAGKDTLMGGAGADIFIFSAALDSGPTALSADVITDFDVTQDVLDLSDMDASTLTIGNQAFAYLGFVSSFTGTAQVRASYLSGNTVLYLNTDTDMSTESVIVLNGQHLLSANDFLL
jgi:serralysin